MKKSNLIFTGDLNPLEHGGIWYDTEIGDAVELTGMHASPDLLGGLVIFGELTLDPEDVLAHYRVIGVDEETARQAAAAVRDMLGGEDYDPFALRVAIDIANAWHGLDVVRRVPYFVDAESAAEELELEIDEVKEEAASGNLLVGDEVFSAIARYLLVRTSDVLGAI